MRHFILGALALVLLAAFASKPAPTFLDLFRC